LPHQSLFFENLKTHKKVYIRIYGEKETVEQITATIRAFVIEKLDTDSKDGTSLWEELRAGL